MARDQIDRGWGATRSCSVFTECISGSLPVVQHVAHRQHQCQKLAQPPAGTQMGRCSGDRLTERNKHNHLSLSGSFCLLQTVQRGFQLANSVLERPNGEQTLQSLFVARDLAHFPEEPIRQCQGGGGLALSAKCFPDLLQLLFGGHELEHLKLRERDEEVQGVRVILITDQQGIQGSVTGLTCSTMSRGNLPRSSMPSTVCRISRWDSFSRDNMIVPSLETIQF